MVQDVLLTVREWGLSTSLRAQRSNPFFLSSARWIASSQGLLAMTMRDAAKRRRTAIKKMNQVSGKFIERATGKKDPKYKAPVFKCQGDYEECIEDFFEPHARLALFAVCVGISSLLYGTRNDTVRLCPAFLDRRRGWDRQREVPRTGRSKTLRVSKR